jgi:hypothetical protein
MEDKIYTKEECENANTFYKKMTETNLFQRVDELERNNLLSKQANDFLIEKIDAGFLGIKADIGKFFEDNHSQHEEIIKHQKHTNGDVSVLKIWRAGIAGGMAVILAIGGFITTFYFIERNDQHAKNEAVIRLEQQIVSINDKLNNWEIIK